ncbi:MAG: putative metallopeptidase [Bacteroidota bacterium]
MPSADTLPMMPPIPEGASIYTPDAMVPDPDLSAWARDVFVTGTGLLVNRDHAHLAYATVEFLWTQSPNRVKRKNVVGRAHLGQPQGSDAWAKAMKADHLTRLFGEVPDFYITLCAGFVHERLREGDEAAVFALIDHELYHCAPDTRNGTPLFTEDGKPKWAMRPHDVEQFVGVTRRWGPQGGAEVAMHEAAQRGPTLGQPKVQGLCANCLAAH